MFIIIYLSQKENIDEVLIVLRKIIKIDKNLCNGCGLCVQACHEGAIGLKEGKAELLRDDYCDGLGNCLPVCPTGAISFEEREAAAFDEEAVAQNMSINNSRGIAQMTNAHTCPGLMTRKVEVKRSATEAKMSMVPQTELQQWPVQLKLVPVNAPYFRAADLLIAADCTAFAYGNFHQDFMKNKITLIGCPKLDEGDYAEKLTQIIAENDIRSISVVRMEVPCCGGIVAAVETALRKSGKVLPWNIKIVSIDGQIKETY